MTISNLIPFPTPVAAAPPPAPFSLRTLETAEQFCAEVRKTGLSNYPAAAMAGLTARGLEERLREDPEFASRLVAAREGLVERLLRNIRNARDRGGSTGRAAQAWLRKNGYEE